MLRARGGGVRVLRSEGFLELPFPLVQDFVREGELQADEADLFAAVRSWVDRDLAERRRHVEEVRVRYGILYFTVPYVVLLRGTILNRTYGTHKNLYISLFFLIFGPIYWSLVIVVQYSTVWCGMVWKGLVCYDRA